MKSLGGRVLGVKPRINAIASVILLRVALFIFLAWFLVRSRRQRSRMLQR